jgi:hypothetical protein
MMQLRPQDIIHKSYLNRVLIEVIDRPLLSQHLAFKGGTCASMLGFLDRFSVDLDFDLLSKSQSSMVRKEFHELFDHLGLAVTKESKNTLFFQVKYISNTPLARNTIKISAIDNAVKTNEYAVQYFAEIDRLMKSQTIGTLFANKLVALTDRYTKYHTIAGRDIYDIHHYFVAGYAYSGAVIEERTHHTVCAYFASLIEFIQKHVTQTIVNEDLNTLLPPDGFREIRKVLLPETLHFLTMEHARLNR